ncbi:MAG TPA: ATP-binding domain-containing protein [Acidimicrobiales bacterium]|nr:ATP-binding domain-containing protein [Acidimicrobiales bacterium]
MTRSRHCVGGVTPARSIGVISATGGTSERTAGTRRLVRPPPGYRDAGHHQNKDPADLTTHPELAAEQGAIDRAYARLEAMRAHARAVSADVLQYGQGGTHSARFERDVRVQVTERRLAALRDADAGLVFGRIDHDSGEHLYVGLLAIADESNEPLVVDWRAPAAEPFYRATPRTPMGLTRRRHFLMRGRRLTGIEDDLLGEGDEVDDDLVLVGEAAILASLRRARTGRMGDIVATIQREQDEIIRAPLRGVLVVQGGPGTGKTAVALHRAAYLLYTHRFPLERSGVLLIGPNRLFLRYIEQVLPSLGEQTVSFATPATLLPAVTVTGRDRPEAIRVKGDVRMAKLLARAVRQRQRPLAQPASISLGAHSLTLTPGATEEIVARVKRRRGTHNERRAAFERQITRFLIDQWWQRQRVGQDDTLDDTQRAELEYQLQNERPYAIAIERMWPLLTPVALLNDLFGAPALLRLAASGVLKPEERMALERPRQRRPADVAWTEDDIALLDEAALHLGPIPARRARRADGPTADEEAMIERTMADVGAVDPFMRADLRDHLAQWAQADNGEADSDLGTRTFGHVLIDEAQDLSPMQARMIGRRVPSESMTILGDLGQASGDHAVRQWDDLLSQLPGRQSTRIVELSVNYRTPSEVMDLAARVLAAATPGLTAPRSVRSTGEAPVVTGASPGGLVDAAAAAARAELGDVGSGRVAVIAPEAVVADLRAALGAPDAGSRALEEPLAVYSVEGAKGLEFDVVVVVEPAAIVAERRNGMRALYVALTRATRRLHLVHEVRLPLPLRDQDSLQ